VRHGACGLVWRDVAVTCMPGGARHGVVRRSKCSLSLWRVARGSKLMHLDLIHGLFIT
jgi:hypothetical protein